jgi:hypothetical protein
LVFRLRPFTQRETAALANSGRVIAADDARGGATHSALGLLWLGLFD